MKNKFFSIVIPCYNVAKYVEQCVESILCQTYDDYEIILINDGSTDNTGILLDEKYGENEKINIIHQKNGGLSNARNSGIKVADGEYLIFIDSDDYWNDKNALEKIKKYIDKYSNDIVVIGNTKFYENKEQTYEKNKINYANQGIEYLIKTNYFKACAWDKIVKSELIKKTNNYFPEGLFSEDIIWCANLLKNTKNIGCLEENFYMYRQREGSITKSVKEKNILDMIQMIEKSKTKDDDIVNSFLAYEYSVALGLISTKNVRKKITKETKIKLFSMNDILNYHISDKVKKVYKLKKIFGTKMTSFLLGLFIDNK